MTIWLGPTTRVVPVADLVDAHLTAPGERDESDEEQDDAPHRMARFGSHARFSAPGPGGRPRGDAGLPRKSLRPTYVVAGPPGEQYPRFDVPRVLAAGRRQVSSTLSRVEGTAAPIATTGWRAVLTDYLELTKPRIIVLLLVTTLAAMLMAARGLPPLAADRLDPPRRRARRGLGRGVQLRLRRRHRREDAADARPAAAVRPRSRRAVRSRSR